MKIRISILVILIAVSTALAGGAYIGYSLEGDLKRIAKRLDGIPKVDARVGSYQWGPLSSDAVLRIAMPVPGSDAISPESVRLALKTHFVHGPRMGSWHWLHGSGGVLFGKGWEQVARRYMVSKRLLGFDYQRSLVGEHSIEFEFFEARIPNKLHTLRRNLKFKGGSGEASWDNGEYDFEVSVPKLVSRRSNHLIEIRGLNVNASVDQAQGLLRKIKMVANAERFYLARYGPGPVYIDNGHITYRVKPDFRHNNVDVKASHRADFFGAGGTGFKNLKINMNMSDVQESLIKKVYSEARSQTDSKEKVMSFVDSMHEFNPQRYISRYTSLNLDPFRYDVADGAVDVDVSMEWRGGRMQNSSKRWYDFSIVDGQITAPMEKWERMLPAPLVDCLPSLSAGGPVYTDGVGKAELLRRKGWLRSDPDYALVNVRERGNETKVLFDPVTSAARNEALECAGFLPAFVDNLVKQGAFR